MTQSLVTVISLQGLVGHTGDGLLGQEWIQYVYCCAAQMVARVRILVVCLTIRHKRWSGGLVPWYGQNGEE